MTFDDLVQFMRQRQWGTLATTDGTTVANRPMGGWAWVERELWCAAFLGTDKMAQLEAVPYGEYCFCAEDGRHVRLAGPIAISTDQADKDRLYHLAPVLHAHVPDPTAPAYVVLRMRIERARAMEDLSMDYADIEL